MCAGNEDGEPVPSDSGPQPASNANKQGPGGRKQWEGDGLARQGRGRSGNAIGRVRQEKAREERQAQGSARGTQQTRTAAGMSRAASEFQIGKLLPNRVPPLDEWITIPEIYMTIAPKKVGLCRRHPVNPFEIHPFPPPDGGAKGGYGCRNNSRLFPRFFPPRTTPPTTSKGQIHCLPSPPTDGHHEHIRLPRWAGYPIGKLQRLMALKRAGRGHEHGTVSTTSPGELLLECPACPHPDRNLPPDWMSSGPLLFLYTIYLAVDANFKLKGKVFSQQRDDVELMPGWGAYVPELPYQQHIANHVNEPEINTCDSQHDAIVRAATRNAPGYAVSGAVLVICSRHGLVRRNGAGDLQKGEKQAHILTSCLNGVSYHHAALIGINLLRIVLTYDIGCQWSKNYRKRMLELPSLMHIPETTQVNVAIPEWHINGHGPACQENFNLGYMPGAGRTVGEDIETTWAGTNAFAPSTREMGPAARHDTFNDHWNGLNFRKIVGFALLFAKRYEQALKMRNKQTMLFEQLSDTFPEDIRNSWEAQVKQWERDPTSPNPYKEPKSKTSLNDVRLILAKEDAREASLGKISKHKMTMTTFLITGFELEDAQYLLRVEASKKKGLRTSKQLADLQDKRNGLHRRILLWREAQLIYMPHVASLLAQDSGTLSPETIPTEAIPETLPLFLPSGLPANMRDLPELKPISQLEARLREPQASDALANVQRQRRVIQGLWHFKKLNVSGTGNKPNTRMVSLYKQFEKKTQRAAEEYCNAWKALSILSPNGDWSRRLRELRDQDIRGPAKDPEDSISRYEPSWIWLTSDVSEDEAGSGVYSESMRVEWVKSRARTKRWQEEVLLIEEEMRRVLTYHRWKADWWTKRASLRVHQDEAITRGIRGYAHKQAATHMRMREHAACYWLNRLRHVGFEPSWAAEYHSVLTARLQQRSQTRNSRTQAVDVEHCANDKTSNANDDAYESGESDSEESSSTSDSEEEDDDD
ncbi:hypothetical protein CPC08DRAFT_730279 [Agrocybe pediades]|nr:hypothetical protein CPC08DRAFT_730279 [Agrocybe pediades]